MMTVWKIKLQASEPQSIQVPAGSTLLHFGAQDQDLCIWFLCNPANPLRPRKINVVGTGIGSVDPETSRYLGTAKIDLFGKKDALVFHAFEIIQ